MVSWLKTNLQFSTFLLNLLVAFDSRWQRIGAGLVIIGCLGSQVDAALPTFENRTPVGFSIGDSS